jgi:hypothetical protein
MTKAQSDQERPCLHCMMVELIDDFFAEYPTATGESDKVDTGEADEVIDAIAKLVAELTCRQDSAIRQQMIEHLTNEIMTYDGEFRREDANWGGWLSRKTLTNGDAAWGNPVPHFAKRGLARFPSQPARDLRRRF